MLRQLCRLVDHRMSAPPYEDCSDGRAIRAAPFAKELPQQSEHARGALVSLHHEVDVRGGQLRQLSALGPHAYWKLFTVVYLHERVEARLSLYAGYIRLQEEPNKLRQLLRLLDVFVLASSPHVQYFESGKAECCDACRQVCFQHL
jgi:hypothetical protein